MNRIIVLGRLVRDPEIRYTPNGRVVAQFTLAVDRPFANQDGQREADFIPVVIWGKQAETIGNSVVKGQRLLVEGRLQIRSYETKDGSSRTIAEIIADRFDFIERKTETAQVSRPQNNTPSQANTQASAFDGMGVTFNEEIPF